MYDRIDVIGAPFAFGVPHSGPELGPVAFRETMAYTRLGDTLGTALTEYTVGLNEVQDSSAADVSAAGFEIAKSVSDSIEDGALPIVVGGDHSVSLGSLQGAARSGSLGVLWIDAHTDFNTFETSSSGNIHGMVLAGAVGDIEGHPVWTVDTLDEENISIMGVRDIDYPKEVARVEQSPLKAYDVTTIESDGLSSVLNTAITQVVEGIDNLHVSIDLDVFDPSVAPGVSVHETGGLTSREGFALMETLGGHPDVREKLVSMDIVELNPLRDTENQTAEFAGELVEHFLHGPTVPDS